VHLGLSPISDSDLEKIESLEQLLKESASRQQPSAATADSGPIVPTQTDLYEAFIAELLSRPELVSLTEGAVAKYFGIEAIQARTWIDRARAENRWSTLALCADFRKSKAGHADAESGLDS
jgi:hypothetical protein